MNINNTSPTTFGIKISPQLKIELKNSIPKNDLKKTNQLIVNKQTNIEQIGSDSFILDVTKKKNRKNSVLVLKNISTTLKEFLFEGRCQRNIIAAFLSLTDEEIIHAQKQLGGRYIL